jgi:hypothetical protein
MIRQRPRREDKECDMASSSGSHSSPVIVIVLFLVWVIASAAGLIAIYIGDEVLQPSANEHSVPPPRTD